MKTILVDAWNTLITEKGVDNDMLNLLESYTNPKIVMTNANDNEIKDLGIDKSPYPIFTLAHKPDKPDPFFYKTFLREFGLDSDHVVYFEHNIDAVVSATSNDIFTYHFDRNSRDLESLKSFLDSNL